MKRTKTLAGSIVGMIVGALSALIFFSSLSVMRTPEFTDFFQQIYEEAGIGDLYTFEQFLSLLYTVCTVIIIFGILYFVLNLVVCILSKASIEKFHKFKSFIIVTIVVGFVAAGFSLSTLSAGIIGLFMVASLAISPILYILDLKNENLQYRTYLNNSMYGSNYDNDVQNDTQVNVNDYNAQPLPQQEESVDEKLTRLLNLKEKGLISDEDYARMRETILNSSNDK